jgi:hypothetical protein
MANKQVSGNKTVNGITKGTLCSFRATESSEAVSSNGGHFDPNIREHSERTRDLRQLSQNV